MADKLIITAALTGAITVPTQTPHLPYTVEHLASDAAECAEAGAAAVHIHARNQENGAPSSDPELVRATARAIKAGTGAIVGITTGGGMGMTPEERLRGATLCKPETAGRSTGSAPTSRARRTSSSPTPSAAWRSSPGRWPSTGSRPSSTCCSRASATSKTPNLKLMLTPQPSDALLGTGELRGLALALEVLGGLGLGLDDQGLDQLGAARSLAGGPERLLDRHQLLGDLHGARLTSAHHGRHNRQRRPGQVEPFIVQVVQPVRHPRPFHCIPRRTPLEVWCSQPREKPCTTLAPDGACGYAVLPACLHDP